MSNSPKSVERVLAALVNMEVAAHIAEAIGGPRWAGRVVAAVGMAAAGDDSMPVSVQRIGRIVSAPGALTIGVLRDQGVPLVEAAADRAKGAASKAGDYINAEFSTEES